ALDARAEERETRGFISMMTIRPVSGWIANWTLEPPVSTLETGLTGLDEIEITRAYRADGSVAEERVCEALSQRAPDNLLRIAQALRLGVYVDAIHRACRVDRWFLRQIADLVAMEEEVRLYGLPDDRDAFADLKSAG